MNESFFERTGSASAVVFAFLWETLMRRLPLNNLIVLCIIGLFLSSTQRCFAQSGGPIPPLPSISGEIAGSIDGKFSVGALGTANYEIEVEVPPGIGGFQPKLSINFGGGRTDGLLATGWSLSGLSAITRCPTTVAQDGLIDPIDYDDNDKFCLDGLRLVVITGTYGSAGSEYRTEIETFSKIIANGQSGSGPESFTVWTKDGQILNYGVTAESRIVGNPNNNSIAYWMVTNIHDRMQKGIEVLYTQDLGATEKLPDRINYTTTSPGSSSAFNSVRFIYEARPSPRVTTGIGPFVSARKRLAKLVAYVGENIAWEYRFSYNYTDLALTDRLTSVSRCDPQGLCLPPTDFSWGSEGASIVSFNPYPDLNELGSDTYNHEAIAIGDWDGDGKTDLARVFTSGIRFFRSTGNGFELYGQIDDLGPEQSGTGPILVGDWNGDGRSDIARMGANYGQPMRAYVSTGHGFSFYAANVALHRDSGRNFDANERLPTIVGDWNGDGRSDIGRANYTSFDFFISTGTDFIPFATIPQSSPSSFNIGSGLPIAGDWNGDGLTDFARMEGTGLIKIFASTGNGFSAWPTSMYGNRDGQLFAGDFNGDGLTDIGQAPRNAFTQIFLSRGNAFPDCENGEQTSECLAILHAYGNGNVYGPGPVFIGDWNNDGVSDIARVSWAGQNFGTIKNGAFAWPQFFGGLGDSNYYDSVNFPYIVGDWNGDGLPDLGRFWRYSAQFFVRTPSDPLVLTNIKTGLGEETQIDYKSITDNSVYSKGSDALYPAMDAQSAVAVISKTRVRNSLGSFSETTFHYSGLRIDKNGRGVSGFDGVSSTDVQTGITTTTSYRQDYPFKGVPFLSEQRQANGVLLNRKTDTWSTVSLPASRKFPYVSRSVVESFELDGSPIKQSSTTTVYSDYGNIIQNAVVNSDGSSETTLNTYEDDISSWAIGQLTRAQVTKATGEANHPSITRTSAFSYWPDTRLVRSETIEPDNVSFASLKTYSYDALGNLIQTATSGPGVSDRSETIEYDSRGQFPIRSTNALRHTESREFDQRFGLVTRVTSPNGLETRMTYDSFGRPYLTTNENGTQRRIVVFKVAPNTLENASFLIRTDESGMPPKIAYYDHLSRELRRESIAFDGRRVFVDRIYDERGNPTHVSDPYFEGTTPQWTVTEFDVRGHPTRVIAPGARQTITQYHGLTTSVTNPAGQISTQTVDVDGRVTVAVDTQGKRLEYTYDAFGNPLTITDPLGNQTSLAYDLKGRKTDLWDPDSGHTSYRYDVLDQVISETNANGQNFAYTYDLLGRLIRKISPEGVEGWRYDSGPNAIGKLVQIDGFLGFSEKYTYDSFGRLGSTVRLIGGRSYSSSQTYDVLGRAEKYRYPSGLAIQSIYNTNGFLASVRDVADGKVYWTAASINPRGQVENQTFGNGLQTDKTFDSVTGLVSQIHTGAIQDLRFGFDSVGNLIRREDARVGVTENFQYDNLNRLIRSQVVGQDPITVTYNALGNIVSRSDVGTYTYNSSGSQPHAVVSISGPRGNRYAYDAAGNRITSNSGRVNYSSAGKPISIINGKSEQVFLIDPSGQRYEERTYQNKALKERKVFGAPLFEHIEAGANSRDVHYIQGGDGVIAVVTLEENAKLASLPDGILGRSALVGSKQSAGLDGSPGTLSGLQKTVWYLHNDHLGSIQTITDENGTIVEISSFDSWGRRRDPTTWSDVNRVLTSRIDLGFTGHEQLDAVGLIHMNGRVYDPAIGRFLSTDPFVQTPTNLQSMNRYSYVGNNPLSFSDPSGYFLGGFFKRITRFIRKALPIVASIVISYWTAGLANGFLLCNTAFSGLSPTLVTGISGSIGGFSGGVAGTLVGGGSPGDALHAGLRGFVMGGLQAGFDAQINSSLPSWSQNISKITGAASGNLQVIRPSDAIANQLFRMGARAAERASIAHLFGGNASNGFFSTLASDAFGWGVNIASEQTFISQYNNAFPALSRNRDALNQGVLNSPLKVFALLGSLNPTSTTAALPGVESTLKDSLGLGVLDPYVNNHGVAGSTNFFVGEAGWLQNQIGMYVPGEQSVSIAHDFLISAFQNLVGGPSPLVTTVSSVTIPPAVVSIQWANGWKSDSSKLRLARR